MPFLQQNDPSSTRHILERGRLTIGRHADNEISLPDDMRVSRYHAELDERDGVWFLKDLRSLNGTRVNGESITECLLRDNDRVEIGGAVFTFSVEQDPRDTVADDRSRQAESTAELSVREKEVLGLLADGLTDQKIAESLVISPATVRSHLDRIRDKTGCRRRPELTRLAIDLGLARR